MKHLSKAASIFSKAGGKFREISGITRQIRDSSLYETSTGRLISLKTKKKKVIFLFDILHSRKKNGGLLLVLKKGFLNAKKKS